MKKLYPVLGLLLALLALPLEMSAEQNWNFTSNSNPKAVLVNANQITIGSASSTGWDSWIGEQNLTWDSTNAYWYTLFTANNGGFNFILKCTNSSNTSYYYKSDGTNLTFSNGKASYDYAINENDGNNSQNFYCSGLTSGKQYIFKVKVHSGVNHCADVIIEEYTGGSTPSQTVTAAVMGINGDWTTGVTTTEVTDNQATITVNNWPQGTKFKIRVNNTWYGAQNATIVNGQWFEDINAGGNDDNMTLPASANGKQVVFTIATDNGHFKASWASSNAPLCPQVNYPGGVPKPGIVNNADGSVTFCFAAPLKNNVKLCGSWNNYDETSAAEMNYQDYGGFRYFWKTVTGLDNDVWYPYYFYVDNTYVIADPYSPLILDQKYDASIRAGVFTDRPAFPTAVSSKHPIPSGRDTQLISAYKKNVHDYDWQCTNFTPAPRGSLSIYETLIRDFTGTDNTADGTFAQALEKIPYLVDLGITAIELMPVMEFQYNTNWGYDSMSHFAVDKSYGSPDELKHFIDVCHQNGIAVILDIVFNHVTNEHAWRAMYDAGESPFLNVSAPHNYSVHNDVRQEYGLVEPYLKDALTNWIVNYKVDGFRFDLVKGMGDSNSYTGNYDGNKSNTTVVSRMSRLHAHMSQLNSNILHINEFFGHYDDDCAMGNDGQLVWNHQMTDAQNYAQGYAGSLEWCSSTAVSRPEFSTVDYVESHDEPWLGDMAKNAEYQSVSGSYPAQAKRLASIGAQLLMAYGPKMIWMWGELGNDDHLGSDRLAEKKVRWGYLDNPDRMAIHDTYRAMLHLRNENQDLFASGVVPVYNGFSQTTWDPRSIRVTKGNKEVICFVNPSNDGNQTVTVNATKLTSGNYFVVTASKDFTPVLTGSGTNISISVPAHSFCVLATNDVAFSLNEPSSYEVSLRGGFNSWNPGVTYTKEANEDNDFIVSFEVPNYQNAVAGQGTGFKVKVDDTWYSTGGEVAMNTWQSVGTASANMTVPAAEVGKTVTFRFNVRTKQLMVTSVYVQPEATGVTLSAGAVSLALGETHTLDYTFTPSDAKTPTAAWASDNEDVATVANGTVTAVAPGTANITVTLNGNADVKATCIVTVTGNHTLSFDNGKTSWDYVYVIYTDGEHETEPMLMTAPEGESTVWNHTAVLPWTPTHVVFTDNTEHNVTEAMAFEHAKQYGDAAPKEGDLNGDGNVDLQDVYYLLELILNGAR